MRFLLILASSVMLASAEDGSGGYGYDVRSGASAQSSLNRPVPAFSQPQQQHQNVASHQNTGGAEYRPFAPALARHVAQQIQHLQHQQPQAFAASPALTRPAPGIQRPIQPQQIHQQPHVNSAHLTRPAPEFLQAQLQHHSDSVVSQEISAQSGPQIREPSFSMSAALTGHAAAHGFSQSHQQQQHHEQNVASHQNTGAEYRPFAPALARHVVQQLQQIQHQQPQVHQSESGNDSHNINNQVHQGSAADSEDSYVRPPNTPVGPYYSGPTPEPIIRKHVSVHFAADEPQEHQPSRPALPPPAQEKHYKILFIKAPTYQSELAQDIPQFAPPPEQKTLVYVLLKKPHTLRQQLAIATPAPTKPSKPEVFFIRYKTPEGPTTAPIYGPPDGASGSPIGESSNSDDGSA